MLTRLLKILGLSTPDDVIGFFVCGMAVLPAFLFLSGEPNAGAVVMLLLFNALLIFGIRNRERENLLADAEELRRQARAAHPDDDPPEPRP